MNRPPRAILVICLRYLGDTLLLRPVFRALRDAFADAQIDALITEGTAQALDDCTTVSHVLEWPQGPVKQAVALGKIAAAGYDWTIDFTGNDRTALVALLSRAKLRVAYDRPKLSPWSLRRAAYTLRVPPEKKKPHTLVQRMKLLEACGVPTPREEIDLVPRPDALAWADEATAGLPAGWVHAHLGSRDMRKAIPPQVARAVFQDVLEQGGGLVVTSGSATTERQHLAECVEGLPTDRLRTFSELDWHQLVALISRCGKYWGSDTAPAHIAAALQKPMLIHYGPSKAEHWKPRHALGVADVRPCECLRRKTMDCAAGTSGACLQQIDPALVLGWMRS